MADRTAEINATLPKPWQAVYDPESKAYYYWNTDTDDVTWDKPGEPKREPSVPLPPGWEEVIDENTGEPYYWHVETDKVQWEPPVVEAAAPGKKKRGKRDVIMAESVDVANSGFVPKEVPKSDASKRVIRNALKAAGFMFEALDTEELEALVMAMVEKRVPTGEVLIKQGDKGDNFYVVEGGDFNIEVNDKKVATRGAGTSFGELALLYNCPRAASVIAACESKVWALDRQTFRYMVASRRADQVASIVTALRKVKLLESLTDEQLSRIADVVQEQVFKDGDRIIAKGDEGDAFYMIKKGKVACTDIGTGDTADVELPEGSYFGERALLLAEPRAANVYARSEVTCLVLNRPAFVELLGPLRELLDRNLRLRVISAVPFLSSLGEAERELIADSFDTKEVATGATVIRDGTQIDTFYVIKSGSVKAPDGKTVPAGSYFCEDALKANMAAAGNYLAEDTCVLFTLSRAKYEAVRAEAASKPTSAATAASSADGQPIMRDMKTIKQADLELMRTLGAGTFGRVKLARHKPTGQPMAVKVLQKAQVVAYGQQTNVRNERDLMAMVDHPFVLKLHGTFQDKNCLYMVLEYVAGGELFTLLANQATGCLPTEEAKFYAACTVSALESMHRLSILYRDLKPENMLIDSEGYLKVVDLGFAKIVKDRTYTLCGTPEYLAPELVLGSGHGKGVDYWAVGVLIYEMLCAVSPFADDSQDQMAIARKILAGKFKYPGWMRDKDARDLINKLLVAKVPNRLGCRKGGVDDIKNHKWFRDVDWIALVQKRIRAPWVPPLKDGFDASQFDDYEDDEPIEPYTPDGTDWDKDF